MDAELHTRVKKAGLPPGTPVYTGHKHTFTPQVTVINYSEHDFHETSGPTLAQCLAKKPEAGITWVNVEGVHNVPLIQEIATHYHLHPLTIEDILNVGQRAKLEEFNEYIFITLKILTWNSAKSIFTIDQISLIASKDFVLSFQESEADYFANIHERLRSGVNQRMREHGSDYLLYRLVDAVVDQYFVVLEGIGDEIDTIGELIVDDPTTTNAHKLYKLKHELLLLRKAVWPMREVISHLLQIEGKLITQFTRLYIRDVYDHTVQAIDTLETFRDILSSMLDMYLSSLTNRLNEVMKTLTIIATIFIPITSIASIYGMNFRYMPELQWHYGYPTVIGVMIIIAVAMLVYFHRKKWL